MNEHEKYFFDVNGYLVVQKILSPGLVAVLNEAIDHNQNRVRLREGEQLLSASSPVLKGDHSRGDIMGILNWPKPWCQPFRELLSHPPGAALHVRPDRRRIQLWQCQWHQHD